MFSLDDLFRTDRRPEPYEPGAELWDDPHISGMMLQAHLSPDTDAASYKPETRQAICAYLMRAMGLKSGDSVVDLGCGPGLYCAALAAQDIVATGIDRSENSIRYAKSNDPKSDYIRASYLLPFGKAKFDAAFMISQDYGVLGPDHRKTLLGNIREALKPNGMFAFDVPSASAYRDRMNTAAPAWYSCESGFWRPGRYFVLKKTIFYPEISALCDYAAVFDADGVKVYHIYQTFFTPDSIRAELHESGFETMAVLSSLDGEPYRDDSPVIGILCKKC